MKFSCLLLVFLFAPDSKVFMQCNERCEKALWVASLTEKKEMGRKLCGFERKRY